MDPQIACPTPTKMLPNGGSPSGGTKVILSGSGLEGATGVRFGSTPASSFTVTSDKLVLATAPPGTGVVPVTIVTPGGPVAAGNFNYFAVTGLSATAGPTTGGNTITIKGMGFNEVGGVEFGLMPAQSFKVVNESEITAEVPLGLGTVDVQVVNGSAASQQSAATQYTYEKGPAGSQTIVEPPSGGDTALEVLAGQTAAYCSQNNCTALGYGVLAQSADQTGALAASSPAADEPPGITPTDWQAIVNNGISDAVLVGCALAGPVSETVCSAIGVGLAIANAWITLDTILKENHKCLHIGPIGIIGCDFWIDPSGTVIDTTGNAIAGATVTLLGQLAGEPFAPVPALSGAIQPAENPETTGASGEFDWDALAGTYKVEATAPGCYLPGNAGEPNVFTSPFLLPPPAVGLTLTLECPGSKPVTPAVTTLFPASGPSAGGNTVVIGGENLAGTVAVRFDGKLATYVKVLSSYAVAAIAPAGASTTNVNGHHARRHEHDGRSHGVLICNSHQHARRPGRLFGLTGKRGHSRGNRYNDQGQPSRQCARGELRQHLLLASDTRLAHRSAGGRAGIRVRIEGGRVGHDPDGHLPADARGQLHLRHATSAPGDHRHPHGVSKPCNRWAVGQPDGLGGANRWRRQRCLLRRRIGHAAGQLRRPGSDHGGGRLPGDLLHDCVCRRRPHAQGGLLG